MKSYPPERKRAIINKMAGPNPVSIAELAKQEGISEPTLYAWRNQARKEGLLLPDADVSPEGWSSADKFNAVLESASLNQHQLSEYCRTRGLFPEQLTRWRQNCARANDWDRAENASLAKQHRENRERIRELESEVHRKNKALADTATIIMLKKKAQEIWGDADV